MYQYALFHVYISCFSQSWFNDATQIPILPIHKSRTFHKANFYVQPRFLFFFAFSLCSRRVSSYFASCTPASQR